MAIKSSGPLSIGADIAGEFGGSTPHSLSEYYRDGSFVKYNNSAIPTGGQLSASTFYGKRKLFILNITANVQQANLYALLTSAGWNGDSFVECNISSGVWLWSDNASTGYGGLILDGIPNGIVINNSGFIIGRGGDGGGARTNGSDGGAAIYNTCQNVTINNLSGAYIAGGGGGGGGGYQAGGGGGAGGGTGGYATDEYDLTYSVWGGAGGAIGLAGADGGMGDHLEESHANANQYGTGGYAGGAGGGINVDSGSDRDPVGGGGGGGRVLPGTGVDARIPGGTNSDYPGGYGGGPNQVGGQCGHPYYSSPSYQYVDADGGTNFGQAGGGGGGWGAAGGIGNTNSSTTSGGAAGKAVYGTAVTINNSGTIYGATS